jgi:hypothetical protein
MRDSAHNMTLLPVIPPAANNNLGTTPLVGAIIDRLGFETLTYGIITGTLSDADATYAVLLEESDAANMDGANAVADADMISQTAGVAPETAAAFNYGDDAEMRKLGYIGNKRYTRLTITPTGANSGDSPIAAIAILGGAHSKPAA